MYSNVSRIPISYLDTNFSSALEDKPSQFVQELVSGTTTLDTHCYRTKLHSLKGLSYFRLTLTVALHATGSVDSISKQAVAWHLLPHDACTHGPRMYPCSDLESGAWFVGYGESLTASHQLESYSGNLPSMPITVRSRHS